MPADADVRELLETLLPPRPPSSPCADWDAIVTGAHGPRRSRRAIAIAIAVFAAILVATPALGLRDEAVELLGGSEAPDPVQNDVSRLRLGPASAYIRLRTSVGARVTLFSSESRKDGDCLGVVWHGLAAPRAAAACGPARKPAPLNVTESGNRVRGSWVALLWGEVAADVERLELVSTTGASLAVPLSASHFLVEVPRWAGDATLIAYGYGGLELARRKLETSPSWTPPDPIGARTPLLVREFANRTWTVYSYEASGDRRCYGIGTSYDTGRPAPWSNGGGDAFRCVTQRELASEQISVLGPDLWPSVRGSGTWASVVGATSEEVARVRVRLASGDDRDVAVRDGVFVYFGRGEAAWERPLRIEAYGTTGQLLGVESVR